MVEASSAAGGAEDGHMTVSTELSPAAGQLRVLLGGLVTICLFRTPR